MLAAGLRRRRAFTWCAVAYLFALLAAMLVVRSWPGATPLARAAAGDLAATLVVFAFSVGFDNSSFYDPYWSIAPIPLVLFWAASAWGTADRWRSTIVMALVGAWAVRLTINWAGGWRGVDQEDWRYMDLRRSNGRFYWLVSLVGIHLMPTALVFLGCVPLAAAVTASGRRFGALDLVAAAVTAVAIWIETTADRQLRLFVRTRADRGSVLDTGLWAWSRHPNYFGEVLFWWGLGLFGVSATPGRPWILAGPLAITALFLFISIPLMERHLEKGHPAYGEVCRRVSRLVPWIPR